jgi:hypothetical protein
MADRKNQHFVPKAVLKPWTLDSAGKAINLYNLRSRRGVQNAPVKNQCSKDYFYGADLKLETWLGKGEGIYAKSVSILPTADPSESAASLEIIRDFSYLQVIRTEKSLQEDARLLREMYDQVFYDMIPEPEPMPAHDELVRDAVERWKETNLILRDLKGVLVINDSKVPFVTSDDPAVHTNKLHIHRMNSANFGIQQSGMILTMPLSPRLAVLYYDGDVYTIPSKVGLNLTLKSDSDAQAFNELQYIKANENVYFSDWNQLDSIDKACQSISSLRMAVSHKLNLLIPVEGKEGVYRPAKPSEVRPVGNSLIHLESISFRPRNWPSQLKYRHDASGFSDGSAEGYVRATYARATDRGTLRKVRLVSSTRHLPVSL